MADTKTAAQIKQWYEAHHEAIENFEKAQNALQYIDVKKSESRTYTSFDLTKLKNYLKNPAANYSQIIELSDFLYTRSNPYRKLINYNASMIDVNYRSIIPIVDFTKTIKDATVAKDFYKVCSLLEPLSWDAEVYKMNVLSWLHDTAYGIIYSDDTGLFILPINYKYAKIDGVFTTGQLSFAIDMSYWDNRQDELNMLGSPLTEMYAQATAQNKWVSVPEEYSYCTKININDLSLPTPAYLPLFFQALRLSVVEDLQSVKDEQGAYKLLAFELETDKNANNPDQFTVDVDTALQYFNKACEALPDYIGAVLSPVKINPIAFVDESKHDTNIIEDGLKALYSTANGGQILYANNISNGTAWQGAMLADEKYATSALRPQVQRIMNTWLQNQMKSSCIIKLLPVSAYTKQAYKEQLTKDFQYGLPLRLALNTLNGFSELETIGLAKLENSVLGLNDIMIPPRSANTTSGNEVGAPKKSSTELSPEGEATRDGEKNNK